MPSLGTVTSDMSWETSALPQHWLQTQPRTGARPPQESRVGDAPRGAQRSAPRVAIPTAPLSHPVPAWAPRLHPPARGFCYGRGGSGTGRDPLASAGREISVGSPTSKGRAWHVSTLGTGTRCWAGALLRGSAWGRGRGPPARGPPARAPWGREAMGHAGLAPAEKGHVASEEIYRFIFCKKINYHPPPPPRSQASPRDSETPGTGWRAGGWGSLGAPPWPWKGLGTWQEHFQPLGSHSGSRQPPPPQATEPGGSGRPGLGAVPGRPPHQPVLAGCPRPGVAIVLQ